MIEIALLYGFVMWQKAWWLLGLVFCLNVISAAMTENFKPILSLGAVIGILAIVIGMIHGF